MLDREITLAFDEGTQGFPSFFTWVSESGISLNNRFFTFLDGEIWEHHQPDVARNSFYGTSGDRPSIVDVVFNDEPSTIKNFKTLGYEGEGEWAATISTDQESTIIDDQVIPPLRTISGTIAKDEFITKEGKKFGYIRGVEENVDNLNLQRIDVQGLGTGTPTFDNLTPVSVTLNSVPQSDLNVGDTLFFYQEDEGKYSSTLHVAGEVTNITENVITFTYSGDFNPSQDDFFLFSKNAIIETSGVLGFFGVVRLSTTDATLAELFSINTESFQSSK